MKFKKQKRHRRSVRFYTTCFAFREPFKVLCDGTFIHHLVTNRISPPDTALSKILGASVKIFTTRCVLAELKSLGNSYSASLEECRNLIPARCDHEKRKSAVACIEEVLGENNPEHFFVATQDVDMRRKFQEIPAVPVIFGLRNALFLESPSAAQLNFAKSDEEKRLHMTELEYKMLQRRNKKRKASEEPGDSSDVNEGGEDQILLNQVLETNSARKSVDLKDKVQFKRKRAKGPNPLSRKKKKSSENPKPVSQEVLPAIKHKWPASESKNIVIQWDNAPPHVSLHRDPDFIAAATEGGFNITLMFQPANSPDTNVNDLGFFRSIQSLQADVQATNVDQLVYAVEQAFNRLSHITLDNVFLTLQTCLKSIMIVRGANNYKIQHMGKAALRRRGTLPNECSVDLQLVRECLLHLLDKGSSDELEGMMEDFS